jgi:hypothetical protein
MPRLTISQVEPILREAVDSFPHSACATCECFLGLVAQLKMDVEPAGKDLLAGYQVERSQIHACLGCNPCPPGERYAAYQREKRNTGLITL